ncbi:basic form of pathogenesis-related protein 1-like [Rutidosis leptorrhynchoides]|uniref:basic form of pathogenesis-related protein 1-like n=1 Tax=Rutidosis leptorrhynchoides TaxID=125765 RepID=UPI003A999885
MELISINSLAIFLLIHSCLVHISLAIIGPHNQDQQLDFLVPHNKARAQVGVQPLTWNTTVAAYARRYAYSRLGNCDMEHSEGPFGENLAEGYGDQFSANDSVNMWVGEKQYYNYDSNSCVGDECLHYTQVVWRDSVHLGCAKLKCRNGWWFVICSYDPPGNYVGQRPY